MEGIFRRGSVWWARLVVPTRLRAAAGRREFVQSTGTPDLMLARVIGSALLATWREQLVQSEHGTVIGEKLLKLVDGGQALEGLDFISLGDAHAQAGVDRLRVLGAAASKRFPLYAVRANEVRGLFVPVDDLDLNNPRAGVAGGYVVPSSTCDQLENAEFIPKPTRLKLLDSGGIAAEVLEKNLQTISLILNSFNHDQRPRGGLSPGVFYPPEHVTPA
jgi:hypothetical protein